MSVVLPAYNEAGRLETTVGATLGALADFLSDGEFEVVIAEDGCDDDTPEVARRLAAADPRVRHYHSDERLGRGRALERAFRAADGDVLVYFDTDLATDLDHLPELVESVRSGEYDVATGSRWMPGREADRPAKRDVASRGFNALVRLFLGSDVRDHQCGFKAFDREALDSLLDDVHDGHWFWDTEVLVRAQRAGYRVREFPVDWTPEGDSKVDLVRDVVGMGGGILRTWWELDVDPKITPRATFAAGTAVVVLAAVFMFQYIDPSALLAQIRGADPSLLAAAAAVYGLSWPLRGLRYRRILAELGFLEGTGFLTGAIFISQTGNLVFPARAGDAIRAYVVKARRGIPYPTGAASIAVERVFDLLTITVLAGAVLAGLVVSGGIGGFDAVLGGDRASGRLGLFAAAAVGTVAVALAGVIVASARSERRRVRDWLGRLSSDRYADVVASTVERFAGDVQRVAADRGAVVRVGASSLLIWALDVLTAILVLAALGVDVPLVSVVAVVFFAVCVGNLAKVLPLSPGGIGLYEGAFSVLVVAFTPVPWAVALGAAIVDHAIKNAVTIVGGFASTMLLNVSLTTAAEEGREVDALPGD